MKFFALFVLTVTVANAAKLPEYFQKCSKKDSDLGACIVKSLNTAWPTVVKGDKTYHIQELSPLYIPHLHINVGGNLKANFTDGHFHGIDEAHFEKINFDLDKKEIDVSFTIPRLNLIGSYDVTGMLLFLPIEGNGPTNDTFVNMKNNLHCEFQIKEKANKHYIDIKQSEMSYKTTRAYFRLDNLFGGNQQLAAAMNRVLDESWEAVNSEIGARLGDALGQIYTHIMQEFFKKVPIEEMFSE